MSKGRTASRRARTPPWVGPARPQIHAVTFDVGGTLIECWPSVGHIYSQVAARHGHRVFSPALLNRRFKAAWRSATGFQHGRAGWSALVDATFRGLIDPPPSRTFFPELFERFAHAEAWRIFPDVRPAIAALKRRGLRLAIVSNWDDRLRPLLTRLELDGYFDTIIVSCEVGFSKPAPEPFAAACAGLQTAPEHTLHVGDSLEHDLRGARAAGLQAVQIQRRARRRAAGRIQSLLALDKI